MKTYPAFMLRVTVLGLIWMTPSVMATPCTQIASDTVAELSAASEDRWGSETARLVRLAAASACTKAMSARYDTSVAAPSGEEGGPPIVTQPLVDTQRAEDNEPQADVSESNRMIIRPMSGPPSRKPYERSRKSREQKDS